MIMGRKETSREGIVDTSNSEKNIEKPLESIAVAPAGVTDEERYQLIAKAAYRLAEQRGFIPGAELDDWLAAEAEIDTMLGKSAADNKPKDA
jgi:hypothetical protein